MRKLGSVGTPMLNVEARVVDDEMNDVDRGEIVYRSPMVMKEYWKNPETTSDAFPGGWSTPGTWYDRARTATTTSSTARRT